jgi:hypothetical protein
MAGDWIKVRKSLPNDPRIVRIAGALKADRFRTLGGVLSAWCLFDEHTDCGRLEGYTPELLDEVIGFPGLANAMAKADWLEIGDGFLVAPRFEKHNGKTAKRRCQETERKRSARNADGKRTREEKRREEKNEDADASSAAARKCCEAHPSRALTQPALRAALRAVTRHGALVVLEGTKKYAVAVAEWTAAERTQFVTNPEKFFEEDVWNQPADNWKSRVKARMESAPKGITLDLGGRKPKAIRSVPVGAGVNGDDSMLKF